jgi:hypothetical protein
MTAETVLLPVPPLAHAEGAIVIRMRGASMEPAPLVADGGPRAAEASFRATGITIDQENGGRLEDAQILAGHADMRTTRLYNRKRRKLQHAEVDRVQL